MRTTLAIILMLLCGCGPRPDLGLRVIECAGRLARDTPGPAVARTALTLADGGHPALAARLLRAADPTLRPDRSDWVRLVIGLAWREGGRDDRAEEVAGALREEAAAPLTRAHAAPLIVHPDESEAAEALLAAPPPGTRLDLLRALTEAGRGDAGAARRAFATVPARHPRRDEAVRRAAAALARLGQVAAAADLLRWSDQSGTTIALVLLRPLQRAERWADAAPAVALIRGLPGEADTLAAFVAAAPAEEARRLIEAASPAARYLLWLARARVEDPPDDALASAATIRPPTLDASLALGRTLAAIGRPEDAARTLPADEAHLEPDQAAEAASLALAVGRPEDARRLTERAVAALYGLQDPTLEAAAGGGAVAALLSVGLTARALEVVARFPESFRPLALGLIGGRLADDRRADALVRLAEGADARGWDTDSLAPELARVGAYVPAIRAAAGAPDPVSRLAALASVAGAAEGHAPPEDTNHALRRLCPPLNE